ncbi:MAG: YoaK family protein [Kofleriaceae bacterium]
MFRHEGADRSHRHNQLLAGYLALIAGFVNSAGFILIGSFTSHVTGNVGRFADDVALGRPAAVLAAFMVVAYFAGAFLASMALESNVLRRTSIYGGLLLLEAALLASFAVLSYLMDTRNPLFRDIQGMLLCIAMGLQNSFVTRLSGAVVRTTHLTGAVTDLGIEGARWFRLWRIRIGDRARVRLVAGDAPAIQPHAPRTFLLLTILVTFILGSALGATLAMLLGQIAMLVPTVSLVAGGLLAMHDRREIDLRR